MAECSAQGKDSSLTFSTPENEVFHSVGFLITECNLATSITRRQTSRAMLVTHKKR